MATMRLTKELRKLITDRYSEKILSTRKELLTERKRVREHKVSLLERLHDSYADDILDLMDAIQEDVNELNENNTIQIGSMLNGSGNTNEDDVHMTTKALFNKLVTPTADKNYGYNLEKHPEIKKLTDEKQTLLIKIQLGASFEDVKKLLANVGIEV